MIYVWDLKVKGLNKLNLEEIQGIQILILKFVDNFCLENNINYYLCEGTLLGAVRHEGYIPWDDDIDISMLRSDYDKFLMVFNKKNNDFKVLDSTNYSWYPFPFAKIIYKNTILKEDNDSLKHEMGINIDLFPIDILPKSFTKQKRIIKKIKFQRNILDLKSITISSNRRIYKNVILYISKFLFIFYNPNIIAKKINKIATKNFNNVNNEVGIIVWGYGMSEIIPKSIFNQLIKLKFENSTYNVPKEYDKWLESVYGDYWKLPPIEDQKSHHEFIAYYK